MSAHPESQQTIRLIRKCHLETASDRIPYLPPADLILLKQDSWREKDKPDLLALREVFAREGPR